MPLAAASASHLHRIHQWLILTPLLLLLLLAPGYWWWQSGFNIGAYFDSGAPPGQWAYLLTKLTGLYGFIAIWLQVNYGLLRGQLTSHRDKWSVKTHRTLGLATLALLLAHFGIFLLAVTLRTGAFPWHLFLPTFASGQYRLALSLGLLALLATGGAATVGLMHETLRKARPRAWYILHRTGVAALAIGLVHGMMVGSETNVLPLTLLYYGMAVITAGLIINRLRTALL